MAFPQLVHPQPQRVHFSTVTFTDSAIATASASNFTTYDTSTTFTSAFTAANESNDSLSVNLSSSSVSSHHYRTDEFSTPLGRRRSPYPTRKICGVDWSSLSDSDTDSDDDNRDRECNSLCKIECRCPPNSISSIRGGVQWVHLPIRDVGTQIERVPTPYPYKCALPKDTKRRGLKRCVRSVRKILRLGGGRTWEHGNDRHVCSAFTKEESEETEGKTEVRGRSGSGSSGSKYESPIRAIFGRSRRCMTGVVG